MKLELEIDVPESREVTFTLPQEVPVGRTRVTVETPFDPLAPLPGTSERFERERRAFFRLLPELLKTHRGKVVAVHDEQVIVVGDETVPVAMEAYHQVGYVPLFVMRVIEEQPVHRLRGPREIRREGS